MWTVGLIVEIELPFQILLRCLDGPKKQFRLSGKFHEKRKLKVVALRGEKLNYKSVAKEISKPPFHLAPEVQWASKFTVFVRFTFPLNVSNHTHI